MKKSRPSAFSLVEVTIALGIIAFGLIVLLGLLPVGLNTARNSSEEGTATNILSAFVSDLRNIPSGEENSPIYDIPVWQGDVVQEGTVSLDANGNQLTAAGGVAQYLLTWTMRPTKPRLVHLRVDWPGYAPQPTSYVETVVALARQNQ